MLLYLNQERINPLNFGDETIERFSEIQSIQFDEKNPNWIEARV